MKHLLTILASVILLPATELTLAAESSLFVDAEPIRMTITAPMRELLHRRRDKADYDATLQYEDAAGALHELPVQVAARGNSRLDVCDFPPVRVTIDTDRAAGTLFAGQRRLKMVTQCKRRGSAPDWLLIEHGIYLAYNEITDFSFRTRLIEITFRDTESAKWEEAQTAFFIESVDEAASRLQRKAIRPPNISPEQFNKREMAHNALFQFLIGNTDFAVKRGPSGEGCCHNGRTLAEPGKQEDWVVLPYDFDQAGVMNTSYALPDERFRIRTVTTRLYRGFCWHNDELMESIALFNERRDKLLAALVPAGVSKRKAAKATQFLNRFFATVNDPDKLQEQVLDKCRGLSSITVRKTTTSGG